MPQTSTEFDTQYAALTRGVGLVDFSMRTQIELLGRDRASFLHNFTTNAVRDLPVGKGCEAFVLNGKGHTIGQVNVFACPHSHVIETVRGQAETLLTHFNRYLIREDVSLHDRSDEWAELLLSGPQAEMLLLNQNLPVPQERLAHAAARIAAIEVWIRRIDLAGPVGFLIGFRRDALVEMEAALAAAGAVRCGPEPFESARIEHGTPSFGRDITDENLPQEIERNQWAISFTKGCYLGQETVARIDALGHVNRLLCLVKFAGTATPGAGLELRSGEKSVGYLTSGCWSPRLSAPLALALVRRGYNELGTKLDSSSGPAEVVPAPG